MVPEVTRDVAHAKAPLRLRRVPVRMRRIRGCMPLRPLTVFGKDLPWSGLIGVQQREEQLGMRISVIRLQLERSPKRFDRLLDASQTVQRRATAFFGFGKTRISSQCVRKLLRGLLEPLRAQVCGSPVVICVRVARGELGCLAKAGDRFLVP